MDKNKTGIAYYDCYKTCPFFFTKQKINYTAKIPTKNKIKIVVIVVIVVIVTAFTNFKEHLLYSINQKC